jgi:hypothetical protein
MARLPPRENEDFYARLLEMPVSPIYNEALRGQIRIYSA